MNRLIGMGPGSMRHVTVEAIERIKAADRVIAFGRIAETAIMIRQDVTVIDKVDKLPVMLELEKENVILASGDPCFYGILDFLARQGITIEEVVPGLSSMQYMMAKLQKSWHGAALVSFHGREADIGRIKGCKEAVILADSRHTPSYISSYLWENGIRGKLYAGFNLSYENELIVKKRIGEDVEAASTLALVVIENEMDQG